MSVLRRVQVTGDLFHPVVPEGATWCGRSGPGLKRSRFANPFKVGPNDYELGESLKLYRLYMERELPDPSALPGWALILYRGSDPLWVDAIRELHGDPACRCPLGRPCHVDVLIELIGRAEKRGELKRESPSLNIAELR